MRKHIKALYDVAIKCELYEVGAFIQDFDNAGYFVEELHIDPFYTPMVMVSDPSAIKALTQVPCAELDMGIIGRVAMTAVYPIEAKHLPPSAGWFPLEFDASTTR